MSGKTLPLPGNAKGDPQFQVEQSSLYTGPVDDNGDLGWDGLKPPTHSAESPGIPFKNLKGGR